jgi:uncharacterized small protein (DUF1192 family)
MDTYDLEPEKHHFEKKNLDVMSIEALGEYIGDLETEIARVRAAISLKNEAKKDGESAFKS